VNRPPQHFPRSPLPNFFWSSPSRRRLLLVAKYSISLGCSGIGKKQRLSIDIIFSPHQPDAVRDAFRAGTSKGTDLGDAKCVTEILGGDKKMRKLKGGKGKICPFVSGENRINGQINVLTFMSN